MFLTIEYWLNKFSLEMVEEKKTHRDRNRKTFTQWEIMLGYVVISVWAGALGGPTHICIHFGLFQVSEFSFNTMMLDRQIRRRIIQLLDTYFAVLLL